MSSSNLDSFIRSSKPPPKPIASSQEIRDRGSTFVAHVFSASSPDDARRAVNHLKHVVHGARRATHEIAAWRCMVLKPDKDGLGGPDDFEVVSGSDDNGEKYGGGKVLKVMQTESVIDAVVIVSRWYGGQMLGPARFEHIETCAREVCRAFRLNDDMNTFIATLTSLDSTLASLRSELALISSSQSTASPEGATNAGATTAVKKPPDEVYAALKDTLDIAKAKRLITARESSIRSVKQALKKARAHDS